jgi:glycine betaine/proline transport system substrate-binding protein
MTNKQNYIIKLVAITFTLLLFVFSFNSYATVAGKDTIRFSDRSWDSIQVHNRIAGFIIKHGYGLDVEYIPGETTSLLTGLMRGDVDVDMESWTENSQEIFNKGMESGKMVDLGSNFPDSWQGWLVPTFVIKGDSKRGVKPMAPGLKSVFDMLKYWELFKDPEDPGKGRFYNSIPGWMVTKINEEKLTSYGLDKYFTNFIPGSDAALSGSMIAAYKKGKPWFGYYWAPTWVLGKLDMTPLEEPPYSEEVWNKNKACAMMSVKVNITVNASMLKRAPKVVEFLRKYETTIDMNNKVLAYMQDAKSNTEDAAIWFLKNYENVWTGWVPQDIVKKVKAALP